MRHRRAPLGRDLRPRTHRRQHLRDPERGCGRYRRRAQDLPDTGGAGAGERNADAEPGSLGGLPARQAADGQRAPPRRSPRPKRISGRQSRSTRSSRSPGSDWPTRWRCRPLRRPTRGRRARRGRAGGRPGAGAGPEPGRGLGLRGNHREQPARSSSAPSRCCAGRSRSTPITRRRIIG